MPSARTAEAIACCALVLAGAGCSFLAFLFTGGDSAFANEPGWVYMPLLVGLALTAAAIGATALGQVALSATFIAASMLAYAGALLWWRLIAL